VASIKPSAGGRERYITPDNAGGLITKDMPVRDLIAQAYGMKTFLIYGAPGWTGADGYDIVAKREVNPARKAPDAALWAGALLRLQTLLENRCSLRVHRETRELPIYTLTAAKGGLKLEPANCIPFDHEHPPAPPLPGQTPPPICGRLRTGRNGRNATLTGTGIAMKDILNWLSNLTGRTVVDGTGYTEPFNASLEWFRESASSLPDTTTAPSLETALRERLGLKLESGKGPVEVLVVDHVERPSAN